MDKSKFYLDLSKCTEEEQRHLEKLTGFKISYIKRYPYLQIIFSGWNQSDCTHLEDKKELTYPEFIKLFEGGESIKSDQKQLEKLEADKAELLEALKKISKVTNEGYITDDTDFQVWESELKQVHSEIESLIQKHKQ